MWTKSISTVCTLYIIVNIVASDLLDENEAQNQDQIHIHKITNDKNELSKYFTIDNDKSILYHPWTFKEQTQFGLIQTEIPPMILNQVPQQEEYYFLYSIPAGGELDAPSFVPINIDNDVEAFSNTYKYPYENNYQVLKDTDLDYIYVHLIPDVTNYHPSQNYYSREPINYVSSTGAPSAVAGFHTKPSSSVNSFDATAIDYNKSETNNNNKIPSNHLSHIPQVYFQPQKHEESPTYPSVIASESPTQGTKQDSSHVEVIKAIGQELPRQVSSHQAIAVTQSYFFDIDSTTLRSPHQSEEIEREENILNNDWTKKPKPNNETAGNTFDDPIVVDDEEDVDESWNKVSSSQYFFSNRKPITFENTPERNITQFVNETSNPLIRYINKISNTTTIAHPSEYNEDLTTNKRSSLK